MLAEALRQIEEAAGEPHSVPEADKQAIAGAMSFMERIGIRAEIIAAKLGLDTALKQTAGRIRFITAMAGVLCLVIGIGATRVLPEGYPARANVVSLLAILLLPNLASLLLWLVFSAGSIIGLGPVRSNGWLGRQALGFYTFLENVLNTDKLALAAGRAWRDYLTTTAAGRHRLVITSHLFWLSALLGALFGCWWLMVVRQVDFVWGSTLLTAADVQSMLGNLTGWVAYFGFTVPSADAITASRIDTEFYNEELRRQWGIFILGAIITIGLLPRLGAIILDLIGFYKYSSKLEPDPAHPGYVRLRSLLMPVTGSRSILDSDNGSMPEPRQATGIGELSACIPQNTAWLALEHKPERHFPELQTEFDLGVVASHAEQQQAVARLSENAPAWQSASIYADLIITPDRGVARQLQDLVAASTRPVHLVLGLSTRAAAMPAADLQLRREDWLRTALAAGVPAGRIHQL